MDSFKSTAWLLIGLLGSAPGILAFKNDKLPLAIAALSREGIFPYFHNINNTLFPSFGGVILTRSLS